MTILQTPDTGLTRPESRCVEGCIPSPSSAPGGASVPWLVAPSPIFKASSVASLTLFLLSHLPLTAVRERVSAFRDACDYAGPTDSPEQPSCLTAFNLIPSAKSLARKGLIFSGSREEDIDIFGWPLFCRPHYYGSKNKVFLKGILVLISFVFFLHLYKCTDMHTFPPFPPNYLFTITNFGFVIQ